ncbi:MAG: ribosome small subunit-dependent GTPase A [Eubacteriales bacterium]|nr:ribosome small subunit-dependent GTPase A [Eubacteriales bacterium]
MINGIITKGIGGFYYVVTEQGDVVECRGRGKLRKMKIKPLVGDRVNITVVGSQGAVEEILPRKNSLIRPTVANIDRIAVVIAAAMPSPDFFVMDKLIAFAEHRGIEVVVCVNKTDLASPDQVVNVYEKAGYRVIPVCAVDNKGLEPLGEIISHGVTAFAGNSGVGKSSILNALGFSLETGSVSKTEHGRHTTRHVELMPFGESGFVIDTPGFSLIDMTELRASEISDCFKEFRDLEPCEYSDCMHIGAKGCNVIRAVEEGRIAPSRYESYKVIYNELKDIKEWQRTDDITN